MTRYLTVLLATLMVVGLPVQRSRAADLRYDAEYPAIGYSRLPTHNAFARLQRQMDSGEVKLRFDPVRGYLDSLLQTLGLEPSSQTLVYSKTSLQIGGITAATPRAIYFNEDTYVAWVQGAELLELAAMDSELGMVFYTLANRDPANAHLVRETSRCLNCHDTFFMSGGGVPRFLFLSAIVNTNGLQVAGSVSDDVTDRTPIAARWGGWYVTGQHGGQTHLGNIQVQGTAAPQDIGSLLRGNVDSLEGLLDIRPYPRATSDIVALLVIEHQGYIQNFITRLNFKARSRLLRESSGNEVAAHSWEDLSPANQRALRSMAEPLVRALLFIGAAPLRERISGDARFAGWFQAQGPHDSHGRSLRELSLDGRLFRYPLSYMVYSQAFDGLPDYARDYIYRRLAEVLLGRDSRAVFAGLTIADRNSVAAILGDTKPEFARILSRDLPLLATAN